MNEPNEPLGGLPREVHSGGVSARGLLGLRRPILETGGPTIRAGEWAALREPVGAPGNLRGWCSATGTSQLLETRSGVMALPSDVARFFFLFLVEFGSRISGGPSCLCRRALELRPPRSTGVHLTVASSRLATWWRGQRDRRFNRQLRSCRRIRAAYAGNWAGRACSSRLPYNGQRRFRRLRQVSRPGVAGARIQSTKCPGYLASRRTPSSAWAGSTTPTCGGGF